VWALIFICGPRTIAAIERFQKVQFPGLAPDGLISPQKRTISRLNSLLAGGGGAVTAGGSRFGITGNVGDAQTMGDQLDLARRLALDAERRIVDAMSRNVFSYQVYCFPEIPEFRVP
jgi:hypothetical protein